MNDEWLSPTLCEHRLPCGWCDLRNCVCPIPVYPKNYEPYPYIDNPSIEPTTVQVYAAPMVTPAITWDCKNVTGGKLHDV